jgi:KaiC/GvpD/RAD55 family RecA-like ATPase
VSIRNLLASVLKSRAAYDRVSGLIEDKDLSEQERVVLSAAREFYERDAEAKAVDPGLLSSAIARTLANPKHREQLAGVVQALWDHEVSPANVVLDFIEVRREAAGGRLATALAAGKSAADVAPLVDEYVEWASRTELDAAESSVVQAKSVAELVAERAAQGGLIRVAPASLNERLGGGLLRGHHMIVFARPEVGKTMFLVNATANFAMQGLRVLYVGNEDPQNDIVMRVIGRLTEMTRAEIMEDPAGAEALAFSKGYDKIVFAELAPGTPAEIEALAVEHKPDVIIVDQLRNLNVREDNFVRALEKAASAVRNIGKRQNAVVLSVTQAGDSASGKSVLDMGDVDNSNTGIPAQADVLLGLGMGPEDEARGMRVLSLCKNKPGGNHDFFPVRVEPAKSYIRSAT